MASSPGMWRRIGNWSARWWWRLVPGDRARMTISLAAVLVATVLGAALGRTLLSGEGEWIDAGAGAVVVLLAALLVWPGLMLLVWLLRRVTDVFGRIGLGAFVGLGIALSETGTRSGIAVIAAGIVVVAVALVFGPLGAMTGGGARRAGNLKKAWLLLCFLGGLAGAGWVAWWTFEETGTTDHLVTVAKVDQSSWPAPLAGDGPGARGDVPFEAFTYGWGRDRHRPEYCTDIRFKTETVNAKPFFKWAKGWKGVMRTRFWGIEDATEVPLNARVWMPRGDGPFPLVLCVHGNHHMADWSDPGYAWLGELLASHGMIFASVDENFLNGSDVAGGFRGENDARAWMLLQHLKQWRTWNAEAGHALAGKADLDRVALVGHSRGGEAVGHAALFNRLKQWPDDASVKFDFDFGIRGIVAIAPVDGQYKPAGRHVELRDVNLLCLHGGHDADVSSFAGDRLFRRTTLTAAGGCFKASAWIYRANHGQFNTVWGDSDRGPPGNHLLNRKALMSGEDQRRVGAVYIGAFLRTVLKDEKQWRPLFRDVRLARGGWLPDTPIITRFEDGGFQEIAGFEEDFDVTTASVEGSTITARRLVVWREDDIPHRGSSRREDTGVWIGWNPAEEKPAPADDAPPPSYEIRIPEGTIKPQADGRLVLHVAAAKEKPKPKDYGNSDEDDDEEESEKKASKSKHDPDADLDFTVELVDDNGVSVSAPISAYARIYPPLLCRMTRLDITEKRYKDFEPVLQTVEIPFQAFGDLDATKLRVVRLRFDRTPKGVIILDRVGVGR